MKCKHIIMLISLIMLVLLSFAYVSATQDINDNANLTTDESNVQEVISSDYTGDMDIQTSDSELENNDALKADGDEAVGSQTVNDSDNDVLGASAEDDVLGIRYNELSLHDFWPFTQISYELKWTQGHNYVLKLTFWYENMRPYSTGKPIYLIGGA